MENNNPHSAERNPEMNRITTKRYPTNSYPYPEKPDTKSGGGSGIPISKDIKPSPVGWFWDESEFRKVSTFSCAFPVTQ
jgi:hypothetical protein